MTLEALTLIAALCAFPNDPLNQKSCQEQLVKCVVELEISFKKDKEKASESNIIAGCIVARSEERSLINESKQNKDVKLGKDVTDTLWQYNLRRSNCGKE